MNLVKNLSKVFGKAVDFVSYVGDVIVEVVSNNWHNFNYYGTYIIVGLICASKLVIGFAKRNIIRMSFLSRLARCPFNGRMMQRKYERVATVVLISGIAHILFMELADNKFNNLLSSPASVNN
jgi:hypothetical protein